MNRERVFWCTAAHRYRVVEESEVPFQVAKEVWIAFQRHELDRIRGRLGRDRDRENHCRLFFRAETHLIHNVLTTFVNADKDIRGGHVADVTGKTAHDKPPGVASFFVFRFSFLV
jgi:hypothetical protein